MSISFRGYCNKLLGLHRIRRTDDSEVAARPDRVRKLVKSHPKLSYAELARLYEQRYHVPVCSTGIQAALRTRQGVYRQRPADPEEKKLRQLRLLKLRLTFPDLSDTELAANYSKRYGVRLSPSLVTSALNEAGLYRNRKPDPDEVKQRAERLKRLYESHPKWIGRRLVEEYKKKYGVELDLLMVTHALTSLGIYRGPGMSRAAIRQREERLKAIAQEHPDLSKAEITRQYNRRFGQSLRISAGRLILRRLGY